jgi:hypothetical protein
VILCLTIYIDLMDLYVNFASVDARTRQLHPGGYRWLT